MIKSTKNLFLGVALGAILSFSVIGVSVNAKDSNSSDTYKQLNLFGDVFELVRSEYVEEVPDEKIIENALNGMLSSLDPHSSFLNIKDYSGMKVQTRGKFGGLGIEVTMENGVVKVVSPIDDTPAFRAGVQAGDLIVQIDNEQVMGMTLSDAVKLMRGKIGTDINVTIVREGEAEPLEIKITRAEIKIKSVRHKAEGDIGYIRITTFNQQTSPGLKKAFKELNKEIGEDKISGYVLDLRNNPGGLLNQAVAVSDAFLEKGEIVSRRGRNGEDTKRDNATPGDMANGKPVIVLLNGGSASASEIVAGALQDHKRGIVLGTQSFGKGSVQTVMNLNGHGAIRLTTARYYTPSGRSIQGKGITPDIIVDKVAVYEAKDNSGFIKEADLKGSLDKTEADKNKKKKKFKKEEDKEVTDYQLTRALDLIRGIKLFNQTLK